MKNTPKPMLLLTCEHAVNTIPEPYSIYFKNHQDLLDSHRGIDYGALDIATFLANALPCKIFTASTSRLLIDFNRSLGHTACFSEATRPLSKQQQQAIIETYYLPYRRRIESFITEQVKQGHRILHLSIHSFTPVMAGVTRNADLGLLYDPRHKPEKDFADQWQKLLKQTAHGSLKIRKNYPYQGKSDGFATALRRQFAPSTYIGIEVETNQSLIDNNRAPHHYKSILATSLQQILA